MKPCKFSPFRTSIFHSATMAVILTVFTAPCALAATRFWDGGSVDIVTDGNGVSEGVGGTWNTTLLNWDAGASPHVAWINGTDTAEINGGTQTLTLGTDISVGRINQKAGASGATIAAGAGPYKITLANATTIFNVAASVTAGRTLNVNAEITGDKNLSIQGPTTTAGGAVNLNRINTFTGTLSIDDTNLRIGNGGTAGQLNSGNYPSAISITSTGTFAYSSSLDQTLSGVISGTGSLAKNTAGSTLVLTNDNTYSGTTTINGGKLVGVVGGHHQNSDVTLNNVAAATYGVSITDNTLSWTCKSLACAAAGTLEFNFGAVTPSGSVSPLVVTNLADFTATPLVSVVVSAGLSPGIYPLMTWGSTSGTVPTTAELTVSTVAPGTVPSLSVSGDTLILVISSTAGSVVKDDNVLPLNNGLSWVGGLAPAAGDVAKWNNIVTSANTTDLGADTTWTGITIGNPNGLVTIIGTNTLTLGAATIDIDMGTATADLGLNCPLALGATNIWNVAATRTLTLGGRVSGAFGITKLGEGTAILSSSANDYTGNTTITAGTLRLGTSNVIPHGAGGVAGNVVANGTLDLNGNSETINGLSGSGVIDNNGAATSSFSVGTNGQTSTFNGVIKSTTGNINLTKTGNGTLTLGGANTFTGTVTINAGTGTLAVSNTNPLANVTRITMGGGTTLRSNVNGAVINAPITLGAVDTMATINASNFDGSGTTQVPFNIGGAISGAGNLTLSGIEATNSYGAIHLKAASDYTGSTLITTVSEFAGGPPNNANIFVRLFVENALPATTVVTLDGGDGGGTSPGRFCELNLDGNDQTLAGLTNVPGRTLRVQRVTSATDAILTIDDSENLRTYSGQITGAISLVKSNAGTWTLSGAKAYTGSTTITGGTLALGSSDVLPTTPVSIGGGTLSIGATFSDTVGTLALTSAATINLGDAASDVSFAASSGETWAGPLTITGIFVSGESIRFGDGTGTGLTPAQLASISASGFTGFALNETGFLTATPTGGFASWIAGTGFTNGIVPLDKRGANDDFDNDGISNLVEYAIAGQDPTVSNTSIGGLAADVLTFTKRTGTSGLTYSIQESTDLGIADVWAEVTGVPPVYVNDATTISFTLNPGTPARNFLRLQVLSN